MLNKLDTIYDHYKDTCSIIGNAIKRRDSLIVIVIIILGLFSFQSIFPGISGLVIDNFLNFKFGIRLNLDISIIGNIIWFLLLIFTLRYFQISVFVERQYNYLHKIEDRLNKEIGEEIITREGKSYLTDYPRFSDFMWLLYTIIFPTILLIVTSTKITSELNNMFINGFLSNIIIDFTAYILLVVSIILYLIMVHKKSEDSTKHVSQK